MRNSSLVEWLCAENVTGLKSIPKLRNIPSILVDERCIDRRSDTERSRGGYTSENAGMSSENYVRIIMVENLRFLGEGSSALGKSEAKARPEGVVDAQTVDIPLPLIDLSTLTQCGIVTRALVDPGVRD